MAKFTQGPWLSDRKLVVGPISSDDDQSNGMIVGLCDVYGENKDANARLIAAAPELHYMLSEFLEQWSGYSRLELDRRHRAGLLDSHTEDRILRARALLARIDGAA